MAPLFLDNGPQNETVDVGGASFKAPKVLTNLHKNHVVYQHACAPEAFMPCKASAKGARKFEGRVSLKHLNNYGTSWFPCSLVQNDQAVVATVLSTATA